MVHRSSRAVWLAAVAASRWPTSQRPVKGTLLSLGRLMRPDGALERPRDELADGTGLPRRTLERHIALAVDAGWLVRERRAYRTSHAVYRAAYPDDVKPAIRGVHSGGESAPPTRVLSTALSAPPGGECHKDQTEPLGEGVALDEERDRRDDHDGGRGPGDERPRRTTEQGGRSASRPRQGLPQSLIAAAGAEVRPPACGPIPNIHDLRSAARGRPQTA
jgi:hypothetical protein